MRLFLVLIGVLCLWVPAVSQADLYQWTDADGVLHMGNEISEVPETYRPGMTVYRAAKPATELSPLPVSPGRTYAAQSQGAFAQKIALDLGLIKESSEDAFGPLRGAGVQPASGWEAHDPLTPEVLDDVLAAARRAAEANRLPLSADGAEAVVRQAGEAFLPPSTPDSRAAWAEGEDGPEYGQQPQPLIIEQPPPQNLEVESESDYDYGDVPFIVGFSGGRHHHGHHPDDHPGSPSPPLVPGSPTHLPFGTSHLPFGATHLPFGSSRER
jgi:Domain of unknown function (DUF4124)